MRPRYATHYAWLMGNLWRPLCGSRSSLTVYLTHDVADVACAKCAAKLPALADRLGASLDTMAAGMKVEEVAR